MAFVYRAPIKRNPPRTNTAETIGPGSYIGITHYKQKSNFAPFLSASRKAQNRTASAKVEITPGPGSYSVGAESYVGIPNMRH